MKMTTCKQNAFVQKMKMVIRFTIIDEDNDDLYFGNFKILKFANLTKILFFYLLICNFKNSNILEFINNIKS